MTNEKLKEDGIVTYMGWVEFQHNGVVVKYKPDSLDKVLGVLESEVTGFSAEECCLVIFTENKPIIVRGSRLDVFACEEDEQKEGDQ